MCRFAVAEYLDCGGGDSGVEKLASDWPSRPPEGSGERGGDDVGEYLLYSYMMNAIKLTKTMLVQAGEHWMSLSMRRSMRPEHEA